MICETDATQDKYSSLVSFLSPSATGQPASDPAPPEQTSKAISLQVRKCLYAHGHVLCSRLCHT